MHVRETSINPRDCRRYSSDFPEKQIVTYVAGEKDDIVSTFPAMARQPSQTNISRYTYVIDVLRAG
jgi:hypothetical protein